ncbi:MAG: putative Ig domain-containing protein [Gammaproteobacteria bacterium]|nr:putative Ig domain-containing protein [Gammaproteobacteria bacterium]
MRPFNRLPLLSISLMTGAFCAALSPMPVLAAATPNHVQVLDAKAVKSAPGFTSAPAYLPRSPSVLVGTQPGRGSHVQSLKLERAGYYRVYAWWPKVDGAGEAEFRIRHADGVASLRRDQGRSFGQWHALGIYAFDGGQDAQVEWRAGSGRLVVDALRFEYLGESMPALQNEDLPLPLAQAGLAFETGLPIMGGQAPYHWRALGALPKGLRLDEDSGVLRGRPLAGGQYELRIRVTDANGQELDARWSLTILEASAPKSAAAMGIVAEQSFGLVGGSDLSSIVAAMPQGEWAQVSLNSYSEVWAPAELRPLYVNAGNPTPYKILSAWSSVAWDTNRDELIAFGGGHGNYSGNDVYRWRGAPRRWERAALASEVKQDDFGGWLSVDGWDLAPTSAHTYDNSIFLPKLDRLLIVGGAAYNNGAAYRRQVDSVTRRYTGPYLWDPNRADANKVGGSTGSHVQRVSPHPEVIGGLMWQNRDMYVNIPNSPRLATSFVDSCSAYAEEGGKDVVYFGARRGGGTATNVYRYVVGDIATPATDTWTQVGAYWNGTAGQATCAYDPQLKIFLRTGFSTRPFTFWNLNTPGTTNYNLSMTPVDASGEFATRLASGSLLLKYCGMDFDPQRRQYALWCGGNEVWMLKPPATVSVNGWTIARQPLPAQAAPPAGVGTGILGKWKYIADYGVFLGVHDTTHGNIWLYKPVGWTQP